MFSAKSKSYLNVLPLLLLWVAFTLALALVFTGIVGTHAEAATTSTVNLALNKPAVASSLEASWFPAAKAFDGNATTRWSSAFSDPQWIYVDLGANYTVKGVKLVWETAYAKAFKIQASNDAVTWADIYSTTTGSGGTQNLTVTPTTARYIRMYGTVRATPWGYSLWGMEVYSSAPTLPDLIVSAVSAPSTAQSGQSFVLSASIKNQGMASASTVQAAFYLTKSASSITGATLLGTQNVGSLSAGASLAITTTLSIPSSTSSGTFYVVAVADSSNATQESNETNNTRASGAIAVKDLIPPTISSVTSSGTTASGTAVTWATDKSSSSQVEYGTTAAYGSSTTLSSAFVTSHAVSLSGLTAGKAYHFRVHSQDADGNAAVSSDYTFTTAALTTGTTAALTTGPAYYVATTGNDANPGTETQPFRTIQKAANVVNPGDTVIVKDGTYIDTYIDGWDAIVHVTRGGTAGNYITFKSENPLGAKLDGQSNTIMTAWFLEAEYIRIEGFEIYGTKGGGVTSWNSHIQVVGNHMHDIGRYCNGSGYGQSGVFASGASDWTIEKNIFHDIGRFDATEQGCTPTASLQLDHGLYIEGVDTITITNNIFYNIYRGFPIHFYNGTSQVGSSNVKILNNTFSGSAPYTGGGHILLAMPGVSNAVIANNISSQPKNGYMVQYYLPTISNVQVQNNITYQGVISASSPPAGISFSGNLDNTDPRFVSLSTHDFYLQVGSPAIDAGVSTTPAVTTDFDGIARPQGAAIDIGAFEFIY